MPPRELPLKAASPLNQFEDSPQSIIPKTPFLHTALMSTLYMTPQPVSMFHMLDSLHHEYSICCLLMEKSDLACMFIVHIARKK